MTSGGPTVPTAAGPIVASALADRLSGRIVTRTRRRQTWPVTEGRPTAGCGLLGGMRSRPGPCTPYWHLPTSMAIMGLGVGMTMHNPVLATHGRGTARDIGSARSLVSFFRTLDGAIGVSAFGAVPSHRVDHHVADGLAALGSRGAVLGSARPDGDIPDLVALPAPLRTIVESAYGHGVAHLFRCAAPGALIAFSPRCSSRRSR
jgi:hypothetical protein